MGDARYERRPVMTRAQVTRLTEQVLSMTSADTMAVLVTHTARAITRFANDRVLASDDGDILDLTVVLKQGGRESITVGTNQITEGTLRALVHQCEILARAQLGTDDEIRHVRQEQDTYLPVRLWYEPTVRVMTPEPAGLRETVIPTLVETVTRRGLRAAGFVGVMIRAQAALTKEGITAFGEETDTEVTVTARTADGTSSGWAGQAARDWSTMSYQRIAEEAIQLALMGKGAQAFEPGRRTAILGRAAVVQLVRYFAQECDAFATDFGGTAFSNTPYGGNKLGQRVFDPRISMRSDPADPDGGYVSYFGQGYAAPKMTWVEDGVLKNLAYAPFYAMTKGKAYAPLPASFRLDGGSSTLEQMIASCREGIYVNRFSSVDLIDLKTGLITGVTRDGCFLVKNGKIDRPVKNFRFLESPFVVLNRLVTLGPSLRAPFGYTPPARQEDPQLSWPRPPMIVPPMMVEDFTFSSLADTT